MVPPSHICPATEAGGGGNKHGLFGKVHSVCERKYVLFSRAKMTWRRLIRYTHTHTHAHTRKHEYALRQMDSRYAPAISVQLRHCMVVFTSRTAHTLRCRLAVFTLNVTRFFCAFSRVAGSNLHDVVCARKYTTGQIKRIFEHATGDIMIRLIQIRRRDSLPICLHNLSSVQSERFL